MASYFIAMPQGGFYMANPKTGGKKSAMGVTTDKVRFATPFTSFDAADTKAKKLVEESDKKDYCILCTCEGK
jgi:hypothetical protein